MSVRQYIGARYVTKVYENSLDPSSAEWESGVTYEPLTLVTYNNSSYLSKKDVPGSIGNPAANPSYWVVTGAYNGQIAYLQSQIDSIIAELDAKKTFAIYIGNSYTSGVGSLTHEGIYARTKDLFDDSVMSNVDGNGFHTYAGHSTTFTDQLQTVASGMTDDEKAAVTHIIAVSAAGDCRAAKLGTPSYSWMESAIQDFIDVRDAEFPNAKIYVTLAEGVEDETHLVSDNTGFKWEYAVHDMFRTVEKRIDFIYMGFIGWEITHEPTYFYSDGLHPNDAGYTRLANAFREAFEGKYLPIVKRDQITTAWGGNAVLMGTIDDTLITFGSWTNATPVTVTGTVTLLDFTNSKVIPAWNVSGSSQSTHMILANNSASITPERMVVNGSPDTGYTISCGLSTDPFTLDDSHRHVIFGELYIKHRW